MQKKAINTTIRHLTDDTKDFTNLKDINTSVCKFKKSLSKKDIFKWDTERELLLNSIALPNLSCKSFGICESEIPEKDLITALQCMPSDISPGNDAFTLNFYEHFSGDLKFCFITSLK